MLEENYASSRQGHGEYHICLGHTKLTRLKFNTDAYFQGILSRTFNTDTYTMIAHMASATF